MGWSTRDLLERMADQGGEWTYRDLGIRTSRRQISGSGVQQMHKLRRIGLVASRRYGETLLWRATDRGAQRVAFWRERDLREAGDFAPADPESFDGLELSGLDS